MANISVYKNFARTGFELFSFRRAPKAVDLEVEIAGGLHDGSKIEISKSNFTIGSSETGEIMLLDDAAAGTTIAVEVAESLFGVLVTLKSEGNTVSAGPDKVALRDGGQTFRLPCTVSLADIDLHIGESDTTHARQNRRGELMGAAVLGVLCCLAFGISMNWGQPIRSNFSITEASAAPMPEVQPAALPSGSIRSLVASSIARKALADHGLSGHLSVLRGAGDTITINGDLPADMRQQWRLARAEIDALSEDAVILYEFEMSSGMPKIPAISSVRLDVNPGLIFADQTELQVGNTLPGGWRLDEINDVGFQLTRQDKSVLIEY